MTPWRIPLGGMRWSRLFRNKPSRNFLWTLNPMNRGRFSACFDRAQARARNQRAQWIRPLLSSRWSSGWGPSKELRNYGVKIISAQRAANVRPFVPRHSDWLSQSRFAESEKNPIENSSQSHQRFKVTGKKLKQTCFFVFIQILSQISSFSQQTFLTFDVIFFSFFFFFDFGASGNHWRRFSSSRYTLKNETLMSFFCLYWRQLVGGALIDSSTGQLSNSSTQQLAGLSQKLINKKSLKQ